LAKERADCGGVIFLYRDVLQQLPWRRYDVVVLSNVLEHLEDRTTFLKRVLEAVVPRRLLIRVPLFERDWRVPLKQELGLEWRLDPTHQAEYTLETFDKEIAAAGLSIVHLEVRWGEIWSELCPVVE
jgi:2-polyprenyl-3-methyl-5-hydroxy-6-metoxy-1,4-benzoquinol methylase